MPLQIQVYLYKNMIIQFKIYISEYTCIFLCSIVLMTSLVFLGAPEVSLTGVRAEINVKVVSLGGGKHRCTYIPVVPGAYLLNITWNGRQLRGSPYKVNVIGTFYPQKVSVSGEGLRGGILGRPMDVAIDTRRAGPGRWKFS